jgi:hypothetical protein
MHDQANIKFVVQMMNNAMWISLCIVQQYTFITSNHESMVKNKN